MVLALLFFLVSAAVSGITVVDDGGWLDRAGAYLLIALLFAVVNTIVGPVLRLLSLPFVLLTLGLFLLVVNAALLGLTAALTDRLQVDGFFSAVLGGLLLAVGGWVAERILPLTRV